MPIAERLKERGLRVWLDDWEIPDGASIPAAVERGLEGSHVLAFCMSANAFGSEWTRLEGQTFRFSDPTKRELRFIPLRLDDAEIPASLAQFKYIDVRSPDVLDRLERATRRDAHPPVESSLVSRARGVELEADDIERRLPEVPLSLVTTREGLHRLAAYVIAPARYAATGKFGLRWTTGGLATPYFGNDRQIRVEGASLVDEVAGVERRVTITTLQDAAEFLEVSIDEETAAEHDTPPALDFGTDLGVDELAARYLGHWFGMAVAGLEVVRTHRASVDPSLPQLWPGHLDLAMEVGDEDRRASYGASPGNDAITEPHLYVSVWWPDRLGLDTGDSFWNADSSVGRVLVLSDFPADKDPAVVSAEFWTDVRRRLGA